MLDSPAQGTSYEEIRAELNKLSPEQKLDLVKTILPAPLQITVGGSVNGNVVLQVNMADRQALADVLEVMSERIRQEG